MRVLASVLLGASLRRLLIFRQLLAVQVSYGPFERDAEYLPDQFPIEWRSKVSVLSNYPATLFTSNANVSAPARLFSEIL